jgi:hypothetical protein
MNLLDRMICFLSPGWGLRRLARRNILDQALKPRDLVEDHRAPSGWLERGFKPGAIPGPESDRAFEALQRLSHFRNERRK